MKHSFFLLLLLTLCCSTNTSFAQTTLAEKIHAVFEPEFSSNRPGGAILLQKGDRVIYQANFGLADLGTQLPVTENTIFNTGSITKTFVAYGILILQEEGKLHIDDPLTQYFGDFQHPEILEGVTLRHLLTHTSGIPDLRPIKEKSEFYLTAGDPENFAPLKAADSLDFAPGTQWRYSNPAFNGLALIIEQVSGQVWQDFIAERIFRPAGMKDSRITNGAYPHEGVAHAYREEEGKLSEYDYGEYPTFCASGNGGVWCSIKDLIRYEKAIQEHRFLGSELTELSRTLYVPDEWKASYEPFMGYSWFLGEDMLGLEELLGTTVVQHTGSQAGFNSWLVILPEKDIVFAGLFNQQQEKFRELMGRTLYLLRDNAWGE